MCQIRSLHDDKQRPTWKQSAAGYVSGRLARLASCFPLILKEFVYAFNISRKTFLFYQKDHQKIPNPTKNLNL